ncbi:hypothetical protein H5410_016078 [Solanum commersonii]|uniref:Uncharacterized protein n=1 Tax=Solanum commersonii TaxID=4109 RepID=A0A9J5ZVG0_SOLCO|nr:hypothetical protein H5410_016078 [Solanum commersonii]
MIAMDLCVWDPGISFEFMALTNFTDNKNEVLLLGCAGKLFLNADSHSMSRVWDPRQPWCVHCYLSNGSCVIYNYIAIPCPSITYKLIIDTYYVVNLGVLVANFERTSVWRHNVYINLDCKIEICYMVLVQKNLLALLSSTIGLQNYAARFYVLQIDIIGPMKILGRNSIEQLVISVSVCNWSFMICLHRLIHSLFINGRHLGFISVVINGDDAVLHDFDYVEVDGIGALISPLDNWELHHYISFCSLVYFVGRSTRIVHLEKWFSGQMLKDNSQMPRHSNMTWIRNSRLQDGKYVALTMLKILAEVCHNVGDGLHLSLPLSCVLPMLSWIVSEYHANYEAVGELNHVNDGIIAAFIVISVPRILWSMGYLEKLQFFLITTMSNVK